MTDAFGRELKVGDQAAYASRYGSTLDVRVLVVVESHVGSTFLRAVPQQFQHGARMYRVPSLLVKLEPLP